MLVVVAVVIVIAVVMVVPPGPVLLLLLELALAPLAMLSVAFRFPAAVIVILGVPPSDDSRCSRVVETAVPAAARLAQRPAGRSQVSMSHSFALSCVSSDWSLRRDARAAFPAGWRKAGWG